MKKSDKNELPKDAPREVYAQFDGNNWMYYDDIKHVDDGEFLVYKFERKAKKTTQTRVVIR